VIGLESRLFLAANTCIERHGPAHPDFPLWTGIMCKCWNSEAESQQQGRQLILKTLARIVADPALLDQCSYRHEPFSPHVVDGELIMSPELAPRKIGRFNLNRNTNLSSARVLSARSSRRDEKRLASPRLASPALDLLLIYQKLGVWPNESEREILQRLADATSGADQSFAAALALVSTQFSQENPDGPARIELREPDDSSSGTAVQANQPSGGEPVPSMHVYWRKPPDPNRKPQGEVQILSNAPLDQMDPVEIACIARAAGGESIDELFQITSHPLAKGVGIRLLIRELALELLNADPASDPASGKGEPNGDDKSDLQTPSQPEGKPEMPVGF
jgi:hypothetical protein